VGAQHPQVPPPPVLRHRLNPRVPQLPLRRLRLSLAQPGPRGRKLLSRGGRRSREPAPQLRRQCRVPLSLCDLLLPHGGQAGGGGSQAGLRLSQVACRGEQAGRSWLC
jgi:hypothetical protein